MKPMNLDQFEKEPHLQKDKFLPHILTLVTNVYTWQASRVYIEALGLGLNEARVLAILYEFGAMRAIEIRDILKMNKATVSLSLRKLEEQKLIKMIDKDSGKYASPTRRSISVHRKIVAIARFREELLLEGFNAKERQLFLNFLQRLYENLQESKDFNEYAISVVQKKTSRQKKN